MRADERATSSRHARVAPGSAPAAFQGSGSSRRRRRPATLPQISPGQGGRRNRRVARRREAGAAGCAPRQAGSARRRGVGAHAPAHPRGRTDPDRPPRRRRDRLPRSLDSREVGRSWLPRRSRRRSDPYGQSDRVRLRRFRRDDLRAALPAAQDVSGGAGRDRAVRGSTVRSSGRHCSAGRARLVAGDSQRRWSRGRSLGRRRGLSGRVGRVGRARAYQSG